MAERPMESTRGAGRLTMVLIVAFSGHMAGAAALRAADDATQPGAARVTMEVSSAPAGAAVFIDGELRGQTPLLIEPLAAGPHQLVVVNPSGISYLCDYLEHPVNAYRMPGVFEVGAPFYKDFNGNVTAQVEAVHETLNEIGAIDKPIISALETFACKLGL